MNNDRRNAYHFSSQAPPPTPIDFLIARNRGVTVALEASRRRLEESKQIGPPTPTQRIEHLTRENGALREEIARLQKLCHACAQFKERAMETMGNFHQAVFEWRSALDEIEQEYAGPCAQGNSENIRVGLST